MVNTLRSVRERQPRIVRAGCGGRVRALPGTQEAGSELVSAVSFSSAYTGGDGGTWSTWSAGCSLMYPGRFSKNLSLTREDRRGIGVDALEYER